MIARRVHTILGQMQRRKPSSPLRRRPRRSPARQNLRAGQGRRAVTMEGGPIRSMQLDGLNKLHLLHGCRRTVSQTMSH